MILSQIPQPDLNECFEQLARCLERIQRMAGHVNADVDSKRRWTRIQSEVSVYCRTVSIGC